MSKECKTLFVRNLPYTVKKDELENFFSEFGPIKQCFVVCDQGKSRGFGYVQYTLSDDAVRAKGAKHHLKGRNLAVDYADINKVKKRERNKPRQTETEEFDKEAETEINTEQEEVDVKPVDKKLVVKATGLKYHQAKILNVSGLPAGCTEKELQHCLQKLNVKNVSESKVIEDSTSAHVKFKCVRDAKFAIKRLHNKAYKDGLLQAYQLSRDVLRTDRRSRVIVRNLSFKCQKDDLGKAFEACGTISDITLPTNKEGKSLGFGFVMFDSIEGAQKAIDTMNSKNILGRPVAVDMSISKARYEATQTIKKEEDSESDEGSDSADSDQLSDDKKHVDMSISKAKYKSTPTIKKEVNETDSDSDSEEDKGSKDADSDDDDDDDSGEDDDNDDSDEDDDNDSDEDDDDDSEDEDSEKEERKKKQFKASQKSDVDEGCTIFIRNLSFDSKEDGMTEFFEQFGDVVYAKVVVNRNTEYSKGMGFVKFTSKESADKCVAQATAGEVTLDGRELIVSVAVSRAQASKLSEKKKEKDKKDSRNLYLAREGLIRPGTQAAEGLSSQDLEKRTKVEQLKREKLKDENIFISPRRLCIRNIPINVDDKELAKIFRTAAQDKTSKITESRIIRDLARVTSEGVGRSQGYGFVAFEDHQHALTALRNTNNNPDIFDGKRRLIVEFSLENRKALEVQQRRKDQLMARRDQQASRDGQGHMDMGPRGRKFRKMGKSGIPSLELSEQDKRVKRENPATPKGLPSHWGAKVRHQKRPSQMNDGRKKGRPDGKKGGKFAPRGDFGKSQEPQQQRKRPAEGSSEGPGMKKSRRQKGRNQSDDFDRMVTSYKNKFINQKTNKKWFD